MAIEKMSPEDEDGRAKRLVTCDAKNCKHSLDFMNSTFHDCVKGMKRAGWKITFSYGTYLHHCPDHHP